MNRHEIPNDVKLRDKDYFKEVALEFNNFFKSMRTNKIQTDKMAQDLEKLCAESIPPHVQKALTEISQTLKKI